jgi:hypothetical protein
MKSLDYGAEKDKGYALKSMRLWCGTATWGGMTDGMAIIDHGAERKSIGHALRNLRHGVSFLHDGGIEGMASRKNFR